MICCEDRFETRSGAARGLSESESESENDDRCGFDCIWVSRARDCEDRCGFDGVARCEVCQKCLNFGCES